jgi:hypothetical protein
MAVSTPAPQTAWGLRTAHPDMTKPLTIEAPCQPILGSIEIEFYNYITERYEFECFVRFLFLANVIRKRGIAVCVTPPSGVSRLAVICFALVTS